MPVLLFIFPYGLVHRITTRVYLQGCAVWANEMATRRLDFVLFKFLSVRATKVTMSYVARQKSSKRAFV